MTLRSRFTIAMLAVTATGIILASGIILYASTRTILGMSRDALLVSCESVVEAYRSFLAENGRVVERIAASPNFARLIASQGISRMISLKAAEAEIHAILADASGIDAIAVTENGKKTLSLPVEAVWPLAVELPANAALPGLPGAPGYVLIERAIPGGRGSIVAMVSLSSFGRGGILPLIAGGGVKAIIADRDDGQVLWNSLGAAKLPPTAWSPPATAKPEFLEYDREGFRRIACRIERDGIVFLAETERDTLLADLYRFASAAAVAAAALLAAGALTAVLISRRLTAAIRTLADAARRIADKDYRLDLDISTGDEMEILYTAFRDMGSEIAAFTADLEGLVAARTAELKLRMEEIERLMVTDTLTGIANRRKAAEALERECARSTRYGNPLCLILFDIDLFKAVNDKFGHATGDLVLTHVAQTASRVVRPIDLVARWGGEEFLAILPETNLEGALSAAEKIRCAMQDEDPGDGPGVTISAGVARFEPGEEIDKFVGRADAAMYESKNSGRNRTSCA